MKDEMAGSPPMASETVREVENAPGYVHLARSILNDPTARVTKIDLRGLLAAYDAERDARERAEREREEAERLRAFDTGTTPLPPGLMLEYERLDGMWRQLVAERDTLRERVAVLQAECQAGRELRDNIDWREEPGRTGWGVGALSMEEYDIAREQTDAAGAMGNTEVGRG